VFYIDRQGRKTIFRDLNFQIVGRVEFAENLLNRDLPG